MDEQIILCVCKQSSYFNFKRFGSSCDCPSDSYGQTRGAIVVKFGMYVSCKEIGPVKKVNFHCNIAAVCFKMAAAVVGYFNFTSKTVRSTKRVTNKFYNRFNHFQYL